MFTLFCVIVYFYFAFLFSTESLFILTMGVKDGAKLLRPSREHTHDLHEVRLSLRAQYPMDGPPPLILIDVSILIVPALTRKQAVTVFFFEPRIPVVSVAEYVKEYLMILIETKWKPVLVLDGRTDPAKLDTYNKRRLKLPGALEELRVLYTSDPPASDIQAKVLLDTIFKTQKKAVHVRSDVLYEVLDMARAMGCGYVGAPFEADSQIIAMMKQGIAEFCLTNDSDLPYQGAVNTIMNISKNKKCSLVTFKGVLDKFQDHFASQTRYSQWILLSSHV